MRKILTVAILMVACSVGIYVVYLWALPAEQKIVRRLQSMARGFNDRDKAECMDGFSDEFVEQTTGTDRDEVSRALTYLFFREIDPKSREFFMRVELPEAEMDVRLDSSDSSLADARFLARFFRKQPSGRERLVWEARVDAKAKCESGDWVLVSCRFKTMSGSYRW